MGYQCQQYVKARRQPRHARVSLHVVQCVDCGCQLQATHLVHRFGERCRTCFDGFMAGAVHMASRYQEQ